MRPRRLKLFFDGGCRPNPGPIEIAVVARGVTHYRGGLGEGSNNDAEWLALLAALALARTMGETDVELVGDCAFVVAQIGKPTHAPSRHYLADYRELASHFARVRVKRVKRSQNLAGIALERRHGRL